MVRFPKMLCATLRYLHSYPLMHCIQGQTTREQIVDCARRHRSTLKQMTEAIFFKLLIPRAPSYRYFHLLTFFNLILFAPPCHDMLPSSSLSSTTREVILCARANIAKEPQPWDHLSIIKQVLKHTRLVTVVDDVSSAILVFLVRSHRYFARHLCSVFEYMYIIYNCIAKGNHFHLPMEEEEQINLYRTLCDATRLERIHLLQSKSLMVMH